VEASLADHPVIIQALETHDAAQARNVMELHLAQGGNMPHRSLGGPEERIRQRSDTRSR
jgi:DNA-binding FadR family transcriptional regulator